MSWDGETFWDRRAEGKVTRHEVEAYAAALADLELAVKIADGHCKSYDPMSIDEDGKVAHSYWFDLWDGGRHHPYESLEQVLVAMLQETARKVLAEITHADPAD